MSGPSRRTPWPPSSSTGPFHCEASSSGERRISHGAPRMASPRGRTRQRPRIRRWLRSVTPPSKWSRRCLPTASTRSSRLPSSLPAMFSAAARGMGVSTSTRSPTRACRRRAARWMLSPSGTSAKLPTLFPSSAHAWNTRVMEARGPQVRTGRAGSSSPESSSLSCSEEVSSPPRRSRAGGRSASAIRSTGASSPGRSWASSTDSCSPPSRSWCWPPSCVAAHGASDRHRDRRRRRAGDPEPDDARHRPRKGERRARGRANTGRRGAGVSGREPQPER